MLTDSQKKYLLTTARETLKSHLSGRRYVLPGISEPELNEKRGVFVTLKKGGRLRGCIGYIEPVEPLAEAVSNMAVHAAKTDPRFPSVTMEELKDIEIEISALTVPLRVETAEEIVMGRDGVIVKRGSAQGVFLPQVAAETGWQREEFLENLCMHKAGLPKDAWKDGQTELYVFQAEVFSETDNLA